MLIQCTALLVEKAGVAPDVTLRFTTCKQVSVQAREPPLALKPMGRVTLSPKQGQSVAPQKWTVVQQIFLKKNFVELKNIFRTTIS